jgi:hypothetical protein
MADLDRLKGALGAVVKGLLRPLDYLALYPAKVVSQAASGALDVQPEDTRLPPMSGVPLRLGLPGCKATVQPGARVLVGFEGGDPRRPVATVWDTAVVVKLQLGGDGGEPAALGQTLQAYLDQLKTLFDTHTHLSGAVGAPTGVPTVSTPPIAFPDAPDIRASKVEVK